MKDSIVEQSSKGILAMIIALIGYMYNAITAIVIVFAFLMLIDYITGMIASYLEKTWDSKIAIRGVIKKVGYIFLLLITILFDYSIINVGTTLGITLTTVGIFTLLTTCWLISTELISVVENLGRMGVPIPDFLKKAFKRLKDTSEKIGEKQVEDKTGV